MDNLPIWSSVIAAVVVIAYLLHLIFSSSKPDASRTATENECAMFYWNKYDLTAEYMYWSDGDRWYAVKDRNSNVLFLCKWREIDREILDYYGRLPEDFKVNYRGKVVLR